MLLVVTIHTRSASTYNSTKSTVSSKRKPEHNEAVSRRGFFTRLAVYTLVDIERCRVFKIKKKFKRIIRCIS